MLPCDVSSPRRTSRRSCPGYAENKAQGIASVKNARGVVRALRQFMGHDVTPEKVRAYSLFVVEATGIRCPVLDLHHDRMIFHNMKKTSNVRYFCLELKLCFLCWGIQMNIIVAYLSCCYLQRMMGLWIVFWTTQAKWGMLRACSRI